MRRLTTLVRTAWALATLACMPAHAIEAVRSSTQSGGVAIEFELQAGDAAQPDLGVASISVRDIASGRAYSGAKPMAWFVAKRGPYGNGELSCEARAKQLASGSLGQRAEVDLNSYRIVTLNHDRTVAFINPFVSLNNAKLESIVELPGVGLDWAYSPGLQRLYVSLREQDAVAVIDTSTRKLLGKLDLEPGDKPTRLLLDEGRKTLWVGLDGRAQLAALDLSAPKSNGRISRVEAGQGLHTLAMSADRQWLFALNPQANTVSVIDAATQRRVRELPAGKTPLAAAWSELAQRLVVATANSAELLLIDPATGQVEKRIALPGAGQALAVFDQGRYALVASGKTSKVILVDLASGSVKAQADVAKTPDQITLSRGFAYVRAQGSNNVSLISLKEAAQGRLSVVQVPMGRLAPEAASEEIGVAPIMATAPEGNGVFAANAPDGVIYRYTEGLMVPSGNFSNYRRKARALMVMDASLAEREAGVFAAPVKFSKPGEYELVVRTASPGAAACFPVAVNFAQANEATAATNVRALLQASAGAEPGAERQFKVALQGAQQKPVRGVTDATLMVFHRGSGWQARLPLRELGTGIYQASAALPHAGRYEVLVSAPSQDLGFVAGRVGFVQVDAKTLSTGEHRHAQAQ